MIELNELRRLVRRDKIDELIDTQPNVLNHIFEAGSHWQSNILSLAVASNHIEMVRTLLERGAQPIPGDAFRDNLIVTLCTSCDYNNPPSIDIFKLLLENGVELPIKNQEDCTHFIRSTLENIYRYDYIDFFQALIDHGFDPVAVENIAGFSIVTASLLSRYEAPTKVAELLIQCGCSPNAFQGDYSSPLCRALEVNFYDFVSKLIDHGADVSALGNTALIMAEHPNISVRLRDKLLRGQDFNYVSKYGTTAIHKSIEYDNSTLVTYLVGNGVDINILTELGTPLMHAVKYQRKDMVKHLVELGADVNALNDKKETVLDIAQSLAGFKRVCSMLIKSGDKTSVELSGDSDDIGVIIDSINKAIQPGEAWANAARQALSQETEEKATLWNTLIRHCLDNNSAKPSKKWMKDAMALVDGIGAKTVNDFLLTWFVLLKEKRINNDSIQNEYDEYYSNYDHTITENNTRLLKGLLWLASRYDDNDMSRTLRGVATQMYKKVYGIGMRNAKLGNAALYSLSIMSGTIGLKEIIVLRAATKYNPALVNINRVFDKLAEANGKTADELAELSIPDYGLTAIGEFRLQLGDVSAIASLVSVGKCKLLWVHKEKAQKVVPAAIKADYADEIKGIKALVKDVQTGCAAHSQRLEQMYLRRLSLNYDTWKEQYVDHKLIGFLARRLIWRIAVDEFSVDVIYTDNGYVTCEGAIKEIPGGADIRLWHPSMSPPQEVLAWRSFLIENEMTQPFKQAHREIYLLTDAERTTCNHSLRFANHILKQSQFHALATHRAWHQQRGGQWDGGSENSAYKNFPAFDMNVCFDAEGAEVYGTGNTGIYECVATSELTFSSDKRVNLEDVDALLFSEVMRDVDLFVGVASIGNDPGWRDRENNYWSGYSFGDLTETANTRKEVLSILIPKLKIASQLSIDGRFLVVKGKLTTYKIHLGSANILMAPNDSYLCIVQVKSEAKVMLPFEGDSTLSLILSKAMMLANDTKIKDDTIISQINSCTS